MLGDMWEDRVDAVLVIQIHSLRDKGVLEESDNAVPSLP
jgi:hypothetical protein